MEVLAIGNSFSQNATWYLHQIARSDGFKLNVVNACIGGCSLERHYRNMRSGERVYELQVNGVMTGFSISLSEALLNRSWDYVTMQQVSQCGVDYGTFQPYLNALNAYVAECAPKAKRLLHQTWAYEQGSSRLCDELGYRDQADMFRDLEATYKRAAEEIHADGIIESGKLFQKLLASGVGKIHADTFHATAGLGQYALGLLWYKKLTGRSVKNISFCDLDETVDPKLLELARDAAETM